MNPASSLPAVPSAAPLPEPPSASPAGAVSGQGPEIRRPQAVKSAPTAPVQPPPALAQPQAQPAAKIVTIPDGLPLSIRLAEDIPTDAASGTPLRFTLTRDFRVDDATVAKAGAAVTGAVVEGARKKFLGSTKITFRLNDVETSNGKIAIRATPRPRMRVR